MRHLMSLSRSVLIYMSSLTVSYGFEKSSSLHNYQHKQGSYSTVVAYITYCNAFTTFQIVAI